MNNPTSDSSELESEIKKPIYIKSGLYSGTGETQKVTNLGFKPTIVMKNKDDVMAIGENVITIGKIVNKN